MINVEEFVRGLPPGFGHPQGTELSGDPTSIRAFWYMTLLMAIRDHATAVHYHPWRDDDDRLAYIANGIRCPLVPAPPAQLADAFLGVARSLLTRAGQSDEDDRRLGTSDQVGAVCAPVEIVVGDWSFLWDAVIWRSGERSGADFYFVSESPSTALRPEDSCELPHGRRG
jgi:hypothetical protein